MKYGKVDDIPGALVVARSAFGLRPQELSDAQVWLREETEQGRSLYGVFDDGHLASVYLLYDYRMRFRSSVVSMGGIGLLCSRLDRRGCGAVRHMIEQSLGTMRNAGFAVSVLDPFDLEFYRKYGWELFSRVQVLELPPSTLRAADAGGDEIRVDDLPSPDEETGRFYNDYAASHYTLLQRGPREWARRLDIRSWASDVVARGVFRATRDGCVVGLAGYSLLHVSPHETKLAINLLIAEDHAARSALLGAVRRLSHQIEVVTLDLPVDADLWPYLTARPTRRTIRDMFMLRIVSFDALDGLEIDAPDLELGLDLEDGQAPWNEGRWTLTVEGRRLRVRRGSHADVRCTIGGASAVLSGFTDFGELVRTGRATALGRGFRDLPRATTFLADYF